MGNKKIVAIIVFCVMATLMFAFANPFNSSKKQSTEENNNNQEEQIEDEEVNEEEEEKEEISHEEENTVQTMNNSLTLSGKVSYSTKEVTNNSVVVTITTNKDVEEIVGWETINSRKFKKEYSENIKEEITIKDSEGNEKKLTVEITWIDKEAPTVYAQETNEIALEKVVITEKIEYEKYNENIPGSVVVTWSDDAKEITFSKNGVEEVVTEKEISLSKREEATYTVTVKDELGNTNSVEIIINNKPTGIITYDTTTPWVKEVIATLQVSEQIETPLGWEAIDSTQQMFKKIYQTNTNTEGENLSFTDLSGKTGEALVVVQNIDSIKPEINLCVLKDATEVCSLDYQKEPNYKNETYYINSEQIKILPQDKESGVKDIRFDENEILGTPETAEEKVYTVDLKEGVTHNISLTDQVENETNLKIVVDNVAPIVTEKSRTPEGSAFQKEVKVVIEANEEIIIHENSGFTAVETDATNTLFEKVYTEKTVAGGEEISYRDLAGNTGTITIEVTNIDNEGPELVILDSNSDEILETPSLEKLSNDTIYIRRNPNFEVDNQNGIFYYKWVDEESGVAEELGTVTTISKATSDTYLLTAKDNLGNESTYTVIVDNEAPQAERTDEIVQDVQKSVTAIIKTNEKVETPQGWTKIDETQQVFSKTYWENTSTDGEVVTLKDLAGNTATINVIINNIDNEAPLIEASIDNVNYQSLNGTYYYKASDVTASEIVLNFKDNEKIKTITINGVEFDDTLTTYAIAKDSEYATYEIEVVDTVGNVIICTIVVDNQPPVITLETTESGTTIKYDEKHISSRILKMWKESEFVEIAYTDTITEKGRYQVVLTDKAGNSTTKDINTDPEE